MRFAQEPADWRAARDRLLTRELALRREMEAVARDLRALPPGPVMAQDYVLQRMGTGGVAENVPLSALFGSGDTLMVYHMMFPRDTRDGRAAPVVGAFAATPLAQGPCPSCTALVDMWSGTLPHFQGLGGNLVVVAKADAVTLAAYVAERGWHHVQVLSAGASRFRADYGSDGPDGEPVPLMTVFHRDAAGTIRLHWASELIWAPMDPGQHMRHLGTVEPLWTLFDLTPGGRPDADEQFQYPKGCCA
jgi:predicted dithiol-disulfide oxidoreductase (DUF899 family)